MYQMGLRAEADLEGPVANLGDKVIEKLLEESRKKGSDGRGDGSMKTEQS